MPAPYDLTQEELAGILAGEPAYRVRQVWDGLHRRVQRPEELTELPAGLRTRPGGGAAAGPARGLPAIGGRRQTTKWLWALQTAPRSRRC